MIRLYEPTMAYLHLFHLKLYKFCLRHDVDLLILGSVWIQTHFPSMIIEYPRIVYFWLLNSYTENTNPPQSRFISLIRHFSY